MTLLTQSLAGVRVYRRQALHVVRGGSNTSGRASMSAVARTAFAETLSELSVFLGEYDYIRDREVEKLMNLKTNVFLSSWKSRQPPGFEASIPLPISNRTGSRLSFFELEQNES